MITSNHRLSEIERRDDPSRGQIVGDWRNVQAPINHSSLPAF